jgi:hypothetical protein
VDLIGPFGGPDDFEQTPTGVERARSIVITEGSVVGPGVSDFTKLDGEGFAGLAEALVEEVPTWLESVGDR